MSIKRSIITASGIVSLAFLISSESVFADTSSFNITSPKGTLAQGEQARIEWLHHDLLNQDIKIQLRGTQGTKGKYPIILPECLANTGSCEWQVPTDIPPGRYRITITSTENKQNYLKGPNFTISASAGVTDNPKQENVSAASCIGGQGHVVKPSTGAKFAQGSTAMLEWQPGTTDETVDLYLDCNQYPIAKGVPNKGYYLWTIPTDSPVGADKKVSVLPGDHSTAGITSSAAFNLQGWKDQEPLQGRMQIYNRDMSGIPKVTAPLEGVRFTKTDPPTLRWTDPDHMLQNRIGIEIYRHHGLKAFYRHNGNNSGVYEVSDVVRKRIERNCGKAPGCYFVVYSRKFPERRITSGHFVTSKAAVAAEASLSVHLQAEGAAPEDPELSEAPMGNKVEIKWTEATDEDQEIRIELLKDATHYLTIIDRFVSAPGTGNTLTWTVPYDLMPGDGYSVSVVPLEAAEQGAASAPFSVLGDPSEDLSLTKPAADDVLAFGAGRLVSQVQWKQKAGSPKLSVKLDLYKDGRRIKTISHETQNPRFKWPVPKTLPSGSDYQIRIEPLRGGDGSEKDTLAFVFSEPFCIRQSTENCDGTPKASAGKVIADTGSVSIVEVSAGASDGSSGDVGGDTAIEAEKLAWECQLRNLPTTCEVKHIEAVDRVCDDKTLTGFDDAKFYLEGVIKDSGGEWASDWALEKWVSYGLDSLTEIAEISQPPRCKSEMEPLLGHAPAKGCGEGTIELAGVCVPDHYCPGFDALDDERSFFPGTTESPRGEKRVCDKYLLQGNEDDEILAGLLEHINEILRFEPHNEEFYRTIWELRDLWSDWRRLPDKTIVVKVSPLGVEPPEDEGFWSFEDGEAQRCLTSVIQRRNQRQMDVFKTYCGDETESTMPERPSWCGYMGRNYLFRGVLLDYPLCNHWRTLDTPIKDRETIVKLTKELLASRFLEVLEANRFGCQYALDTVGDSPLTNCWRRQPYWNTVGDQMGQTYLDGEWVSVPYEAREPADWGFWWPDQALITDPEVIEDLRKRDPIKAAHAEFIRLMAAYHEASEARRAQIEIMAEAEEMGSDIDRREARTIRADEYLDVPLQFDSKYGLGNFSTNRRLSRNDNRVVVEDVWLEPWGRQPSQRRIYSKPAKLFSLAPLALSSEVTCGDETDLKEGLCVAGGGSCPAWRIASIGGCKLCPDGLSPNKSRTVCEDKGCERNHFWDAVSQSCVNDRDKRQDRWVQMNLVGGFPDSNMEEVQNKQFTLLQGQLKAYAEQEDRSRDYVNVVGRNTGYLPHPDWGTDTSGVPEAPAGGYSELIEDQCASTLSLPPAPRESRHCRSVARTSYRQSVIEKQISYDSDLSAESYWDVEPEWTETINYDFAFDGGRTGPPLDNSEMLRGLLQRGLSSAEKGSAVFALNFSGHGLGWDSAGVDIRDMREIIGDQMQGAPLDLVTFDSCRMGAYEALLMLEGRTKWVVAHTTHTPLEGWNPEGIGLAILGEETENKKGKLVAAGKGMKVAEMIKHMMDEISTQGRGEVLNKQGIALDCAADVCNVRYDSVVAYQMDRFANFREAFNDVLRGLTEKLRETPEGTLKKLSEIRKIGANEVGVITEVDGPRKLTGFYHVDDFLEEISKAFDGDAVVKTASNRATTALKRLTRKKPDNEQARMIFTWCDFNPTDHVKLRDLCITSLIDFDPTLKVLYDFNKAMRDAMMP